MGSLYQRYSFRGKTLKDDNWVFGYLSFTRDFKHAYISYEAKIDVLPDEQGCLCFIKFEVNPATVGQFTGKNDKHGKEIYEGDIVKGINMADDLQWAKENGFWGIVEFSDVAMPVNGGEYKINYYGYCIKTSYSPNEIMTRELIEGNVTVIGNVWENPELLGVKAVSSASNIDVLPVDVNHSSC